MSNRLAVEIGAFLPARHRAPQTGAGVLISMTIRPPDVTAPPSAVPAPD